MIRTPGRNLRSSDKDRRCWAGPGLQSLLGGFALALLLIYFLLAISFRSYGQPLIVILASHGKPLLKPYQVISSWNDSSEPAPDSA